MKKLPYALGILLGLFVALAAVLLAASHANDAARASKCQGHLYCITIAMHDYHDKYGHFPPAYRVDASGKPAHSWRVLLFEFLNPELYAAYRFDEPWDGPNNSKLSARMPGYYACPSDHEGRARHRTNYFVVVGEETVFPGPRSVSLNDIERDKSSTVLLVESSNSDIHWMEPKDLSFNSVGVLLDGSEQPSVSARHRRGPSVCMVDGTLKRLSGADSRSLSDMLKIR